METRTHSSATAEGIVFAEFGVGVVGVFRGREIVIDISVGDILTRLAPGGFGIKRDSE